MRCPKCNGRKYIELDKVGLLVASCSQCEGTGEVDDTISGTGQPDNSPRSGDTGQSKQPQKRKTRKKAGKGTR
uniref:Uncharacterized protein n=1 Tax=viral metagenome TaxID=1070528 RepID=A0A6M3KAV8_9ZZZZ